MTEKTVLIAGATGVVGQAAAEYFARLPQWRVLACVAAAARRRLRVSPGDMSRST